jgi:hypothetical protein
MSNKQNDIIFEQEAEFAEKEHEGGFHTTYQENCPVCYAEDKILKGSKVEDIFSFENTLKMVGNINKAIYNINPYE